MKLEATKLSKRLTKTIFAEVLKGKPLDRTLMNYALSEFELSGNTLDLGSGSSGILLFPKFLNNIWKRWVARPINKFFERLIAHNREKYPFFLFLNVILRK